MTSERSRGRYSRAGVGALLWCALLVMTAFALGGAVLGSNSRYATWQGIGPDKWASVWLIKRRIEPRAEVVFLPPKSSIEDGVAFDVPGAEFQRTPTNTTFESLLSTQETKDEATVRLAGIVREMEIGGWSVGATSGAAAVERAFRALQMRYDRLYVPFACYMQLFDNVHAALASNGSLEAAALIPGPECATATEMAAAREPLVAELAVETVLARVKAGDRVVFVDTRESEEYDEFHIPGAVNIKLREIGLETAAPLADADLVVPYCVKDFRGYEVARALREEGIEQVAIMNPYGIKGWRTLGLPVAGRLAHGEEEASRMLRGCIVDIEGCLNRG